MSKSMEFCPRCNALMFPNSKNPKVLACNCGYKSRKVSILKIKEKTQKEFYAEYKEMFNKRTKFEEFIQKKDLVLIRNEERIRGIENSRNDVSIKKAILGGEAEGLRKEFEMYKDIQLRRGIELDELNAEIKNFENHLRNLGNVNLRALEIYEKVDEEYKNLIDKFDRLKLEKDDVIIFLKRVFIKEKTEINPIAMEACLGQAEKQPTGSEKENKQMKKFLVIKPTNAGTKIRLEHLSAMRTGGEGVLALDDNLNKIINATLQKNILEPTKFDWCMLV